MISGTFRERTVQRWATWVSAAALSTALLAACQGTSTGKPSGPDLAGLAAEAARTTTCQASLPLARQLGDTVGHPSAASIAVLTGMSRRLQVLSDASQDSLLQQRLQNLVDEITVLKASWQHHSARTLDVTDRLRGMASGFGRTCTR